VRKLHARCALKINLKNFFHRRQPEASQVGLDLFNGLVLDSLMADHGINLLGGDEAEHLNAVADVRSGGTDHKPGQAVQPMAVLTNGCKTLDDRITRDFGRAVDRALFSTTGFGAPFLNEPELVREVLRTPLPRLKVRYTCGCGLASHGPDTIDAFKRAAIYVDRILTGAKPSELCQSPPLALRLGSVLRL
jgi:hypothetical protein